MFTSRLLGFSGSLIINNSRRNQLIHSSEKRHFFFLFYLHGVNHQGEVVSDSNFSWLWSDAEIFDHKYLGKESNDIKVFCTEIVIKRMKHLQLTFLLRMVRCNSCSIRLSDSLINNI